MDNLSIVVITKNEEKDLRSFLCHLNWAEEIIVVDDYSTDDTLRICGEFKNVKVYQNKFVDFSSQRNCGIKFVKNEWILSLDPDEVVSSELKKEIEDVIKKDEFSAYNVPTKNIFYGRWLRHGGWYPDYHIRLFRKNKAFWNNMVHERMNVDGITGILKEPIEHFGHRTIAETLKKLNLYTDIEAEIKVSRGIKFSIVMALFEPLKEFSVRYFFRLGFFDGFYGLVSCFFISCYRFFMWAKVYQLDKES